MEIALLGVLGALALVLLGVPVGFSLAVVGFVGIVGHKGWDESLYFISWTGLEAAQVYWPAGSLILLVLIGNILSQTRFSEKTYTAFEGTVFLAMRRKKYADSLGCGVGVFIAPCIILQIYATMAEISSTRLILAGLIPGILGVAIYGAIAMSGGGSRSGSSIDSLRATRTEQIDALPWALAALGLFGFIVVILAMQITTIFGAAAIATAGALVLALASGKLTPAVSIAILVRTARSSAMLFIALTGAMIFAEFVTLAGLWEAIESWSKGSEISLFLVFLCILGFLFLLGCVLDPLSLVLISIPVTYPFFAITEYDPVWFGIVVLVMAELSLLTPPNGIIVSRASPEADSPTALSAAIPFIVADVARVAILFAVPAVALYPPSRLLFQ